MPAIPTAAPCSHKIRHYVRWVHLCTVIHNPHLRPGTAVTGYVRTTQHRVTAWRWLPQRACRTVHNCSTVVRSATQHVHQQQLSCSLALVAGHKVRVCAVHVRSIFSKVRTASIVAGLPGLQSNAVYVMPLHVTHHANTNKPSAHTNATRRGSMHVCARTQRSSPPHNAYTHHAEVQTIDPLAHDQRIGLGSAMPQPPSVGTGALLLNQPLFVLEAIPQVSVLHSVSSTSHDTSPTAYR